jgi:DNA-binding MarR family transcriptional regulator
MAISVIRRASSCRNDYVEYMPRNNRPKQTSVSAIYIPPLTTSRKEFISGGSDQGFREMIYLMVLGLDRLASLRGTFGSHLGLTGSQFVVLMGVAYRQGRNGVSIGDLADHVRLAQPHVTTEVGRLLRSGLLVKRANPCDHRSVLVSLSSGGKKAVEWIVPLVRKVNDLLFAGVRKNELLTVTRVMRQLAANADDALAQLRISRRKKKVTPLD